MKARKTVSIALSTVFLTIMCSFKVCCALESNADADRATVMKLLVRETFVEQALDSLPKPIKDFYVGDPSVRAPAIDLTSSNTKRFDKLFAQGQEPWQNGCMTEPERARNYVHLCGRSGSIFVLYYESLAGIGTDPKVDVFELVGSPVRISQAWRIHRWNPADIGKRVRMADWSKVHSFDELKLALKNTDFLACSLLSNPKSRHDH